MNRRNFLKQSVFASGTMMIPGFLKSMEFLNPAQLSGFKNLIILQLSGGNDGLNTIIPVTNDIYHKSRPDIRISTKESTPLTDDLSLNNALSVLRPIYDQGEWVIINNVGYPNPNRSHFRSTDIWQTASSSNQYLKTGWIGRYLDANCEHPYQTLEIDSALSLALKGNHKKGIAVTDPKQLYQATREPFFSSLVNKTEPDLLNEHNQGYLYKTLIDTQTSAAHIYKTSKIYQTKTEYPKHPFAKNLKTIADLMISGLDTRVYYSSLSGFDNHVNQRITQERLLKIYAKSVNALIQDLKMNDRFKDTLILTFSEFGRRVKQNASKGTDHGAANNIWLMGGALKKAGIYNEMPDLTHLDKNGDIKYSVDFRSIYATVLDRWLGVNDKKILDKNYSKLDFI